MGVRVGIGEGVGSEGRVGAGVGDGTGVVASGVSGNLDGASEDRVHPEAKRANSNNIVSSLFISID